MDQRRTILAIGLSFGILLLWNGIMPKLVPSWFPEAQQLGAVKSDDPAGRPVGDALNPSAAAADGASGAEKTQAAGEATAEGEAAAAGTEPGAEADSLGVKKPEAVPETKIELSNEKVKAVFSSHGAAISSWQLTDPQFLVEDPAAAQKSASEGETLEKRTHPVEMVVVAENEALPFSTTFEGLEWPSTADYQVVSSSASEVTFRASDGELAVVKHFSFKKDKPYALTLEIKLERIGASAPEAIAPRVLLSENPPATKKSKGFLSFLTQTMPDQIRPTCAYGKEIERRTYDEDEMTFAHTGDVDWVSIGSRYFLTAMYRVGADGASLSESGVGCKLEIPKKDLLRATMELPKQKLGESVFVEAYLGPKFKTQLASYGHGLEKSIDFGFFGILSIFLLYLMTFFQGLVGNWGVSIILLTVTVKGVLLPLTNWSMRSMERMRAIQPKMKALKEKHGKDQPRFQQEMMKLYREEGVSPFGGCLPMVMQFPIWIALYRTILNTAELYHTSFITGWLEDLSAPEVGMIKILPILMGVTMFAMQKMQPMAATTDDSQAKMQKTMMYMMPPFFTLIMYSLPTGLTLYIFVNNLLSIAQQYYIRQKQTKLTEQKNAA